MVMASLGTAVSILVAQHQGRDDFDTAKLLAQRFAVFMPLGSMLVGLVILAASPVFLPWLLDPKGSLYQLCMQLLWVMCLSFWIKVLNMTLIVGVLRAGGDGQVVLVTDLVSMWLLAIPTALTAAFVYDLAYVWVYAMVLVEEIVKCGLIVYRARQGFWLKNLTRNAEVPGGLVRTSG